MGPGRCTHPFLHDQEEDNSDSAPENAPDSPSSGDEARTGPSPKKRKGMQKRVISVPIMGVDDHKRRGDWGSNKNKGEGSSSSSYPPSDLWVWRKYGQKPIKGSPYPRGYYRCSSTKGCPARKQVERSHLDPTMLLITYSFDHNHPLPDSKHILRHHQQDATKSDPEDSISASASASAGEFVAADIGEESLIDDPDFHWLTEAASAISYPRRPIYAGSDCAAVAASAFSMGEEEESLFGDLGELPECDLVFRFGNPVKPVEMSRQCGMNAAPCVGHAGYVGRSN